MWKQKKIKSRNYPTRWWCSYSKPGIADRRRSALTLTRPLVRPLAHHAHTPDVYICWCCDVPVCTCIVHRAHKTYQNRSPGHPCAIRLIRWLFYEWFLMSINLTAESFVQCSCTHLPLNVVCVCVCAFFAAAAIAVAAATAVLCGGWGNKRVRRLDSWIAHYTAIIVRKQNDSYMQRECVFSCCGL